MGTLRLLPNLVLVAILVAWGCAEIEEPSDSEWPNPTTTSIVSNPSTSDSITDTTTVSPVCQDERSTLFLSYDESLSTAGAQLAIAALESGSATAAMLAPWGRPYEFLNLETFEVSNAVSIGRFQLQASMSRRVHPDHAAQNLVELGLHVTGPTVSHADRQNVVLTLVLDVSGSMGDILDATLDGLESMTESLRVGDVVSLVTFNTEAQTELSGYTVTGVDRSAIRQALRRAVSFGGTDIEEGLRQGYELAHLHFHQAKLNRVWLITDANLNTGIRDPAVIGDMAAAEAVESIFLSGIGIGAEVNEGALNAMTEPGNGAAVVALTNEQMQTLFSDLFLPLIQASALDLRYQLDVPPTFAPLASASEQQSTVEDEVQTSHFFVNTDQMLYEQYRETEVCDDSQQSVSLTLRYTHPDTLAPVEETLTLTLETLLSEDARNLRRARLLSAMSMLMGGRIDCEDVLAMRDSLSVAIDQRELELRALLDETMTVMNCVL